MAKIERVEDLPKWFSLEKYSNTSSLTTPEWFVHLNVRQRILRFFKSMQGVAPYSSTIPRDPEELYLELEQLRTQPVAFGAAKGRLWAKAHNEISMEITPVRDMSFYDLVTQFQIDQCDEENGPLADRWKLITDPNFYDFPRTQAGALVGSMVGVGEPVLVNLEASDVALKDAFAAWLKKVRTSQHDHEVGHRKSFPSRWARYGLLPYLDLLIWAVEIDNHIPDRVMSAAIRHNDAGESNLRKTIAPLAAGLMRDLSGLQTLIAAEAPAPNTDTPETLAN